MEPTRRRLGRRERAAGSKFRGRRRGDGPRDPTPLHLRELLRGLDDERRLARLAAMRNGREEGRVRLDEHGLERQARGGRPDVLGRAERDHPGEGHQVAQIERLPPVRGVFGEGVEDARPLPRSRAGESSASISCAALPVVQDDGQAEPPRAVEHPLEDLDLLVPRRVVVVEVEADLADRGDLGPPGQRLERGAVPVPDRSPWPRADGRRPPRDVVVGAGERDRRPPNRRASSRGRGTASRRPRARAPEARRRPRPSGDGSGSRRDLRS